MLWFGKKKDEKAADVAVTAAAPAAVESAPASEPASASEPTPSVAPEQDSATSKKIVLKGPSGTVPAPAEKPEAAVPARTQPSPKALYYNLMNALYDAVLVVDDNGHLMDCNERVDAMFGYSREDAWDMPITQLVPALNAQIFAQMKNGLHGNRRVLVNARCRRKDGTTFPGEVGAGLMVMRGENLVITIRNIEKRTVAKAPAKAIIRPANVTKTPAN